MSAFSPFRHITVAARPVVLLLLLGSGLGLMWHLANNLIPQQGTISSPANVSVAPAPSLENTPGPTAGAPQASLPVVSQPQRPPSADTSRSQSTQTVAARENRVALAGSPEPKQKETAEGSQTHADSKGKVESGVAVPASLKDLQARKELPRLIVNSNGNFIATEPILFNTGLATLREVSLGSLDKLAALMKEHPDIRLTVIGHTDNLGVESVNEQLSTDRAAAVAEYLVSLGIEASRLASIGLGSKNPIASNDTQLGRQANRRIEFLVTSPK